MKAVVNADMSLFVCGSLALLCKLVQLGKVIGGGLPVGAYGGRKEIMQMVAPAGLPLHFISFC